MATTRARGSRTLENPALAALQWVWAAVLSLLFIAVGLALVFVGAICAYVGVQAVMEDSDLGHVFAGALFAVLGLAAVGSGAMAIWMMPRAVKRLSGCKPPSLGGPGGFYGGFGGGGDGGGGCGGGDGGGGGGGGGC